MMQELFLMRKLISSMTMNYDGLYKMMLVWNEGPPCRHNEPHLSDLWHKMRKVVLPLTTMIIIISYVSVLLDDEHSWRST